MFRVTRVFSVTARAVYPCRIVVLHIARIAERERQSVYGLLFRLNLVKGVVRGGSSGTGPRNGGLLDQHVVRDLGACM